MQESRQGDVGLGDVPLSMGWIYIVCGVVALCLWAPAMLIGAMLDNSLYQGAQALVLSVCGAIATGYGARVVMKGKTLAGYFPRVRLRCPGWLKRMMAASRGTGKIDDDIVIVGDEEHRSMDPEALQQVVDQFRPVLPPAAESSTLDDPTAGEPRTDIYEKEGSIPNVIPQRQITRGDLADITDRSARDDAAELTGGEAADALARVG